MVCRVFVLLIYLLRTVEHPSEAQRWDTNSEDKTEEESPWIFKLSLEYRESKGQFLITASPSYTVVLRQGCSQEKIL